MSAKTSTHTLSDLGFGNLLKKSWVIVKKNYWSLVKLALASFLISLAFGMVGSLLDDTAKQIDWVNSLMVLIAFTSWIVRTLMDIGWTNILIRVSGGKMVEVQDLFSKKERFFHYLFGAIGVGLLVALGLILLIVPGIIWLLKYSQVLYLIVDKDMGIGEAMKKSAQMTNGSKGTLFLYGLGFMGITLVGLIPLGLGLLVTVPLCFVANGLIYHHLLKRTGA